MDIKQAEILSNAIKDLADAIRELGSRIAEDEPLNYSIGRGFSKIAEAIDNKQ